MSRKTAYNQKLGDEICMLVRNGVHLAAAASATGIDRATLFRWRQKGEEGRAPYAAFVAQLDMALGAAETNIMLNVVRASRKDWRAGAWWIERQNPDLEQKLQRGLEALIEELRPLMSETAYAELVQALAAVMGLREVDPKPAPRLTADIIEH